MAPHKRPWSKEDSSDDEPASRSNQSENLSASSSQNAPSTSVSLLAQECPNIRQRAANYPPMAARLRGLLNNDLLRLWYLLLDAYKAGHSEGEALRRVLQANITDSATHSAHSSMEVQIDEWVEYMKSKYSSLFSRLEAAVHTNYRQLGHLIYYESVDMDVGIVNIDDRRALFVDANFSNANMVAVDIWSGRNREFNLLDELETTLPDYHRFNIAPLGQDRIIVQIRHGYFASPTCLILAHYDWETLEFRELHRTEVQLHMPSEPIVDPHCANKFVIQCMDHYMHDQPIQCIYGRIDAERNQIHCETHEILPGGEDDEMYGVDRGVYFPRLCDGRLHFIREHPDGREEQGAHVYQLLVYDFGSRSVVEQRDFLFREALNKKPFKWSLVEPVKYSCAYAWDDSSQSPILYVALSIRGKYEVYSFDAHTLDWRRTELRGIGHVRSIRVADEGRFLTLSLHMPSKRDAVVMMCRFPLRTPDTLRNLCCFAIRRQRVLFNRDLLAGVQLPPNLHSLLVGE